MNRTYEINKDTLALIPVNKYLTKVYENSDTFMVENSVMHIIDHSCKYFGSSYMGRHEGTKSLIGISHKSPIIIEESRNLIYFPTSSPRKSDECCWISLNHINHYRKNDNNTIIIFENGSQLELNISIGSFDNQYSRAIKLENVLRKRKIIE